MRVLRLRLKVTKQKKDPKNVALGRAITTFREANGLTQEELAKRAGIPLHKFLPIEKGEIEAPSEDCMRIARGCGVDLSQLFVLGEKFADREQQKRPRTSGDS